MKYISTTRLNSYHTQQIDPLHTSVSELQEAMIAEQENIDGLEEDINEIKAYPKVINGYIRSGATALSVQWLSETSNGTALTPDAKHVYTVVTEGDYYNKLYRWDSQNNTYVKLG